MAIALLAVALLLSFGITTSNADADITVYRGGAVDVVTTSRTEPVVLRGGGSLRDRAATPAATPRRPRIATGDTLWLIDEDSGKITACSPRNAAYTGKRRIVCTRQQ